MMNTKTFSVLMTVVLVVLGTFTGCSSDDEYSSHLPEFSGLEVASGNTIYVGDTVKIQAAQTRLGSLIDRTTYKWSTSDEDLFPRVGNGTTTIVYPNNTANPACYFVAKSSGSYTVTFVGSYNPSGQAFAAISNPKSTNGSTISYSTGTLRGEVTISKSFVVYKH